MKAAAVIFPGQGAQKPGMGQDFCQAFAESRRVFEQASEALGFDMGALCFTENEQLNQTEFTQPAILTAEIAMLEALRSHYDFQPRLFAGHSLGEYTALVAAGVIPFADAVKIVRKRGALMQRAVPEGMGAMAALICDNLAATEYLALIESAGAEVANFNSNDQTVISGRKEAVEKSCALLAQQCPNIRAVPLNVSAPFHCSLMTGIEAEFQEYFQSFASSFNFSTAGKVISNFFGGFHCPEQLTQGMVKQISGSVNWLRNMETLKAALPEADQSQIFEIGPARILSKFLGSVGLSATFISDQRSLQKALGK